MPRWQSPQGRRRRHQRRTSTPVALTALPASPPGRRSRWPPRPWGSSSNRPSHRWCHKRRRAHRGRALLVGVVRCSGCGCRGGGGGLGGAHHGGIEVELAVLLAEHQYAVTNLEVGVAAALLVLAQAFDELGL